jgi:hypothetical protein
MTGWKTMRLTLHGQQMLPPSLLFYSSGELYWVDLLTSNCDDVGIVCLAKTICFKPSSMPDTDLPSIISAPNHGVLDD